MKILFWNVDTQRDFVDKTGALYVEGAETIRPNLKKLTAIAKEYNIQVVNTGDCHTPFSKELSNTPDYKTTFPPHCLPDEDGIDFIPETCPETPYNIDYLNSAELNAEVILRRRNINIYKDDFDVFIGNPKTSNILRIINPELVIVYGVATNVCVDKAVQGLLDRGRTVFVVSDAIKGLPNMPVDTIYNSWTNRGVKLITTEEVAQMFLPPPAPVEPKKEEELITPVTEPTPKVEDKPVVTEPPIVEPPKVEEVKVEEKKEEPTVVTPIEAKPTDPTPEPKKE